MPESFKCPVTERKSSARGGSIGISCVAVMAEGNPLPSFHFVRK